MPLVPGDHAGEVVALVQGPAHGEQCGGVGQVDYGVVDDERLLPRGLGAGEQDDVVRGGHLLKEVAAIGLVAGRNDEHEGTCGQEGVLRIGGRQDGRRERGVSGGAAAAQLERPGPVGVVVDQAAGVEGGEVVVQPGDAVRELAAQVFEEVLEADPCGAAWAMRRAAMRSRAR